MNFLSVPDIIDFLDEINSQAPDIVLLGGDISDSQFLVETLQLIENELKRPIYFVLGNHDFYHSSFSEVRKNIIAITQQSSYLEWLTEAGFIELTPNTVLIGHDSWTDGRYGDYENSTLMLNDYLLIKELKNLNGDERLYALQSLGDAAANYLRELMPAICKKYSQIILLTHVPPFREACWHNGQISDNEALPHFSCKIVGEVLIEIMQNFPECHLKVLCGHTHSGGEAKILPNLWALTGSAEYGKPKIQQIFDIL